MRPYAALLAALLVCNAAHALPVGFGHHLTHGVAIPPPVDLTFRVTTEHGTASLTIPNIGHYTEGTAEQYWQIDETNALMYGSSFETWESLVPAESATLFLRFGDVERTTTEDIRRYPVFDLDHLIVAVRNYGNFRPELLEVSAGLGGDDRRPPIPEPSSWLPAAISVFLVVHGRLTVRDNNARR